MKRTSWLALGVLSLGWGTRGVATRAAFEHDVTTVTVVAVRLAIAAAIVFVAQTVRRRKMQWSKPLIRAGMVMGITNITMPFWLFSAAFQYASAGFVGLMAALTPLGTAVFAHLLLPAEALTKRKAVGLALGIVGVAVLLASGDSGLVSGGRPLLAVAWSLPGVAAFSFSTAYAKREAASIVGLDILVIQLSVGAVLTVVPMLVLEGVPRVGGTAWALLTYLAVASTVVPLLLFYWVLVRSTAGQTALVGYLVPVVSVVAGVVLLGERVEPGLLVGGVAILTGVLIADREHRIVAIRPA
jgi:drug/metabolite transporter (DMT)-like permease